MVTMQVQYALTYSAVPSEEKFQIWSAAIPSNNKQQQEVSLRIVDEQEMKELNMKYRNKACSTNVLSFSADLHEEVDIPFLGDVVICAPVVEKEATDQGKSTLSHWAHMTVHGILHLQGYDHTNDAEAAEMEQLEIQILYKLGFDNPYV